MSPPDLSKTIAVSRPVKDDRECGPIEKDIDLGSDICEIEAVRSFRLRFLFKQYLL